MSLRSLLVLALGMFLFVQLLSALSVAQEGDGESPNLIHRRHMHTHNQPHAKEPPTDQRFYTTRPSNVVLPLPNEKDAFTFVVFGDRTGGPVDGVNVLADAVRDTNLIEPDLVMTVGDLINGYNQRDEWMVEMKEFKSIMDRLLCPWFPVAGNHDVYWRPLNDPNRPKNQHDDDYEMHFGPLWYSFQHKNSNFIAIYSDEGNPETGEKNFSDPELQKISPEQFEFLQQSLERGKDCDHQFIFLHHPRWLGGGYGDDWKERVHPLLLKAGNVTAVFAGHIHHMRYDAADGIEYVTLATVGGVQESTVPEAGFLHHYHLVTVRKNQVAMAAFPVGEAMNVREITGELQAETVRLAQLSPAISGTVQLTPTGPVADEITVTLNNPTSRVVDYSLTPTSRDNRWRFSPDHTHGLLPPGESKEVTFRYRYKANQLDDSFDLFRVVYSQDYLAPTTRYAIPDVTAEVDLSVDVQGILARDSTNRALRLAGDEAIKVANSAIDLPQGPMTLECWFRANRFGERVGLLAKTEVSEYGIFVSQGNPVASLYLGNSYRNVQPSLILETDRWYHLAMVYDTESLVMYLDGKEVDRESVSGQPVRKLNELPLFIGADTSRNGEATSFFDGDIDEVRLSKAAMYRGEFTPERRLQVGEDTVFLYGFDQQLGPVLLDSGPGQHHVRLSGDAVLMDVP